MCVCVYLILCNIVYSTLILCVVISSFMCVGVCLCLGVSSVFICTCICMSKVGSIVIYYPYYDSIITHWTSILLRCLPTTNVSLWNLIKVCHRVREMTFIDKSQQYYLNLPKEEFGITYNELTRECLE